MSIRAPLIFLFILNFVTAGSWLGAQDAVMGSYEKQASDVSQKRFEQKSWSGNHQSDLMQKTFPFKQWDSHYSSLGSKKSSISVKEAEKKKDFKSEVVKFPTKEMDISDWDGQLAKLERDAQISTDKSAQKIADKRLYDKLMQESDHYSETGKKLSLRDINRFQFRQNRSDSEVPVTSAGSGGDS